MGETPHLLLLSGWLKQALKVLRTFRAIASNGLFRIPKALAPMHFLSGSGVLSDNEPFHDKDTAFAQRASDFECQPIAIHQLFDNGQAQSFAC